MTFVFAMATLAILSVLAGLLLTMSQRRWQSDDSEAVDAINRLLPQTQCAQCGYPGCRPYAEAIVNGEAINKCPPGGDRALQALADLLGREAGQLEEPEAPALLAVIREEDCIGCTLCIKACPVDAIIGAPQQMHTVIERDCTGCELCLPPCPVDCIDLVAVDEDPAPDFPPIPTPCIHCGDCEPACPRALAPQQLLLYRDDNDAAQALDLDECVECRRCDRACPSDIPLTSIFQVMKARVRQAEAELVEARALELRFERRGQRLNQSKQQTRHRPDDHSATSLLSSLEKELDT